MCGPRVTVPIWKNILCVTEASQPLRHRFFEHVKLKKTFSFQHNGILSGIMKHNFSFSGFNTWLKKCNFLLLTETIANNSLCMKIIPRLDNSQKSLLRELATAVNLNIVFFADGKVKDIFHFPLKMCLWDSLQHYDKRARKN